MGQIGGLELFLLCTCSFFGAFLELRLRQGQLFVFRFCRVVGVYIGYRASATGAIDVGMNLGDQIRRGPRRLRADVSCHKQAWAHLGLAEVESVVLVSQEAPVAHGYGTPHEVMP